MNMRAMTCMLLAGAGLAQGQTFWNNASGGAWTVALNWDPADVPNTASEFARVVLPGTYVITVSGVVGVGGLELFNPDATLTLNAGATLTFLSGLFVNDGLIRVNPTASTIDSILAVSADTVLSGSGSIVLNGSSLDSRLEATMGATLTQQYPHVIRGRGRITGLMVNESSIIGDSASSALEIAATLTQTGAGACIADGGSIGLPSGGRINGGALRTLNGGLWRTVGGVSTLDGVTNEGDGFVTPGTTLRLESGGMVNDGVLVVNTTASTIDALFDVAASATLSGAGQVRLNGAALDAQLTSQPEAVLTNAATHTISGRGRVLATVMNHGMIVADVAGGVLEVSGAITQSATGVCSGDEGILGLIQGGLIEGGTLDSVGDGRWQGRSGTSSIRDIRNAGIGEVRPGAVLHVLAPGITNDGEIIINPTASTIDAVMQIAESSVVDGEGVLRLHASSLDAQLGSIDDAVLTNGAEHTIAGRGRVSATIVNHGLISGDNLASPLEISGVVTQSVGGVCMGNEAILGLVGGTLVGGVTDTIGAGLVQARSGSSTISGITNLGLFDVAPGATLQIESGGVTNEGVIRVNTSASSIDAILDVVASATISGSGRLALNGAALDATLSSQPGAVLTNGADHTIAGRGRILATVHNEGRVDGDFAGGALQIAGMVTQAATGVLHASSGTLGLIGGSSVSGGILDGTGDGSLEASSGASSVSDVRVLGTFYVRPSATVLVSGEIVNDGLILINPTASSFDALVTASGPVSMTGNGEVRLRGNLGDSQLNAPDGSPVVLGAGQRLSGIGRVEGEVTNAGVLAPGLSVGSITIAGQYAMAETSVLEVEIASTSSFDRVLGNAQYLLDGVIDVQPLGGFTPVLGNTFIIMQGSSFAGVFRDVTGPDLGGLTWRPVYKPTTVELKVVCKADFSGSTDPNDPNYGVPDLVIDATDFFYYLDIFVAQDPRADLTGTSDPTHPDYGIKDGVIDASDFFFFLDLFTGNCG
ncbi:MAG: hypothetical protein KIT24_07415 [Phycisphaeraceae bacterium]|nr:hypothetical protein [Phycisphaeraceae bacterium]